MRSDKINTLDAMRDFTYAYARYAEIDLYTGTRDANARIDAMYAAADKIHAHSVKIKDTYTDTRGREITTYAGCDGVIWEHVIFKGRDAIEPQYFTSPANFIQEMELMD